MAGLSIKSISKSADLAKTRTEGKLQRILEKNKKGKIQKGRRGKEDIRESAVVINDHNTRGSVQQ